MTFNFSTKAQTLELLQGRVQTARIASLVYFTYSDWCVKQSACISNVHSELGNVDYIVRSSCQREDGITESNAGCFLSLANVNNVGLEKAIQEVFSSYGDVCLKDEVLIQPMLKNVLRSGVAFSHDPNTCSPYRLVNWSEGQDTEMVTGGKGGHTWQQASMSPLEAPRKMLNVVALLNELLELFGNIPIDCEFAITGTEHANTLWLLQARPLILARASETEQKQMERLKSIENKVARGMASHPFLMGGKTVYGVMPDWNPAEIIGLRPKPLSLSLYRELITDAIWAYQRHNYGYRNLRSFPLMLHFSGLPYIDVRLSFNSFIPTDLDEDLGGRLVDYYIQRLLAKPTLHDKVEFEIVFSCYTLDLHERLEKLEEFGFSVDEQRAIAESLRQLTNKIINPKDGLWQEDKAKLDILKSRRAKLLASRTDTLDRIYWLLEDAKRYGTLPFAGLARAGFVAVQLLKSLVTVGILSQSDYDAFIASVDTISGQMAFDYTELDQTTFLSRYGHLRPGTYNLLSPRYDEKPELYFDWNKRPLKPQIKKPFSLTLPQMRKLSKILALHGLNPDAVGLFDFLQAGIELREEAKFDFTRNLSDALALITEYGEQLGFSREDLSYCDISVFKELHVAAVNPVEIIHHSIQQGKARYQETLAVSLPPLILHPEDVWAFYWPATEPNFITQKQVTALVATADQRDLISNAVVCIPNADPGYDWLFSYSIAGLITAWGGVNSHMAIRAGEMGIPAVIGAGEVLYGQWSKAKRLHIDCAGHRVEVLA